jgi:cytochrome c nitrite reductase small subunit
MSAGRNAGPAAWWGLLPRRITIAGLALAALLGTFAGSGAYTFRYAEGLSYLSNDPTACVNCHIMREQFDSWQKSPHHAVATCNDCHVPIDFVGKYYTKVEHGWRHSKGFTLQDFHEPIQMKDSSRSIVQENCLRCHGALVAEVVAAHRDADETPDCIRCHSQAAHGPVR